MEHLTDLPRFDTTYFPDSKTLGVYWSKIGENTHPAESQEIGGVIVTLFRNSSEQITGLMVDKLEINNG